MQREISLSAQYFDSEPEVGKAMNKIWYRRRWLSFYSHIAKKSVDLLLILW
jgi:hypothetical protein